jgi:hypothetical protein
MLRLPKPGTFETLVSSVVVPRAGLWRLSKRPASEPYWARGAQSRFDDPAGATPGAATFGVLYAGQDPETAFCESVIHENSLFLNGAFVVSKAGLVARALVGFKHPTKPSLTLADLTGARLKTLGLNNDIAAGDDYCVSGQPPHLDSCRVDDEGVHLFRRWTPWRRGQGRRGAGIRMS